MNYIRLTHFLLKAPDGERSEGRWAGFPLSDLAGLINPKTQDGEKVPSKWVRITSVDGYTFIVERKVALSCGMLRNTLNDESTSLF
jgi:hypothetical protein